MRKNLNKKKCHTFHSSHFEPLFEQPHPEIHDPSRKIELWPPIHPAKIWMTSIIYDNKGIQ